MPHVEHVLPMIPGGASFKDIITGEEVLRRWLVSSAPRNQGCEMHVRRTQLWALVYLHPLDLLTQPLLSAALLAEGDGTRKY